MGLAFFEASNLIMTRILALETSALDCSVALSDAGRQVQDPRHIPQAHTRHLLGMVDGVLDSMQIAKTDLDAIAFGQGPGSFTGLRICASFAQGLAFGLDIPLIPMSSLWVLAQTAVDKGLATSGDTLCCLFDARMDEVYFCEYKIDENGLAQPTVEEQLCAPESVNTQATIAVGRGLVYEQRLAAFKQFTLHEIDLMPEANSMLGSAAKRLGEGEVVAVELGQPVYLRGKSAWQ